MADTRLSDLSAAGALSASDLFYVVQTPGSGGAKATGTQLLTLVGTAYVPLAGGTMTGALTIASGTLTASAPALNITQTWNSAAVAFSSLSFNITRVAENGLSTFLSATTSAGAYLYFYANGGVWLGNSSAGNYIDTTGVSVGSGLTLGFSSTANGAGTFDVALRRDAAATLALRNGTNQQSFLVYNTESSGLTNYERLKLTGVAGTSVNIKAETLGTGADNLDIVLTPAGTGKVKFPASTYVNSTGHAFLVGLLGTYSSFDYSGHGLRLPSEGEVAWTDTGNVESGTKDTALFRNAAGVVEVTNGTAGTWRDLKLRNLLQTEYHEVAEMTAPSAPAKHSVRIYAENNGAGKTRLMALFNTGAAQQLAIEP